MQVLYEEMESSLASSVYEVVGYFDIKPNDALSSQCSYLGSPDGFRILCPYTQESSMFFVLCQWRRDVITFLS